MTVVSEVTYTGTNEVIIVITLLTMSHQVQGSVFDLQSLFILSNLWYITSILQNKTQRIQMVNKFDKS